MRTTILPDEFLGRKIRAVVEELRTHVDVLTAAATLDGRCSRKS